MDKPEASSQSVALRASLADRVLRVSDEGFDLLALDIFAYQVTQNPVYREYCALLGKNTKNVRAISDIPFLPVTLFRTHTIRTNVWQPQIVFESSTTTGQIPSRHAVRDLRWYHDNTIRGFHHCTGKRVSELQWLALLPSYSERPGSSLVSMAGHFIAQGRPGSRFLSPGEARMVLENSRDTGVKVALISVSFALLDLAESGSLPLHDALIIETGGMKGRRTEPTRDSLHQMIKEVFEVSGVYAEYGMTELLSQAWSTGKGLFKPAPTLRICTRELSDPMTIQQPGSRGPLNCIDLANLDTCAFVASDDVGKVNEDGSFEVFGRLDASELRGCNLMYAQDT